MFTKRITTSRRAHAAPGQCVVFFVALIISLFQLPVFANAQQSPVFHVNTSIGIAICDNGIVDPGETCDVGLGLNDGEYSSTTAGRRCAPGCRSWGPYCGDGVLKAFYGEECNPTGPDDKFCSMACKQTSIPVSSSTPPNPPPQPSGSGGGSSGEVNILADTKVIVSGKGYPNSRIQVLRDGQLQGVVNADASANFRYEMINATPGPTTLAFWSQDAKGTRSITQATSFQVTQNAVTYVNNLFLPPTIRAKVNKVAPGSKVVFEGTTVPLALANIVANKERIPRASMAVAPTGEWSMEVPTEGLVANARHQFFPFFTITAGSATQKSSNGMALSLYIGDGEASTPGGKGDLNGDGKVGIADLSILLGHWGQGWPAADLNGNGRVDIGDLSIMLAHWTG